MLASGSDDHSVFLWDLNLTGSEQARENYEDGPPEMVVSHVFHTSPIEDLQWEPKSKIASHKANESMVASVETDTQVQIWSISKDFTDTEVDILHLMNEVDSEELE